MHSSIYHTNMNFFYGMLAFAILVMSVFVYKSDLPPNPPTLHRDIQRIRDNNVTCYTYLDKAISCVYTPQEPETIIVVPRGYND